MKQVSGRPRTGGFLSGLAVGAALTLLLLRIAGIPLQRGIDTPAFQKFFAAYHDMSGLYYRSVSQKTLLDGAIVGMTHSLGDPFTDYFTPTAATQFHRMLSGQYVGIGVIMQNTGDQFVVSSVIPDSPAARAHLRAKDIIVAVDGHAVQGLTTDAVANRVLGPAGTRVRLTIQRPTVPGRALYFTITRAPFTAPTVYTRMLSHHIGYLQITVIGDGTATEVDKALTKLRQAGATRLLIDLRDNGGGYLDQATSIANHLIPAGKVILQTQGRTGAPVPITSQGPGTRLPIAVLMDGNTASAAEVLAAALHEDVGSPLIGTRSFGKGTVQETQMYTDGSGLKYTVARWLTPNGTWINKKGLVPTLAVSLPAYVSLPALSASALPLRKNDNNTDVSTVQQILRALGYTVDRVDGYFDLSTQQAVSAYQRRVRLPVSGSVNPRTATRMEADLSVLTARSDTQLLKAQQVLAGLRVRASSSTGKP